jgi:hypothetical protein
VDHRLDQRVGLADRTAGVVDEARLPLQILLFARQSGGAETGNGVARPDVRY